ncbi:DUF6146 family protein [Flavobacterium stagni]|uniref:Lipoprotein n=1 Tax=Flavobacterium stagni TaxID=2506421 RepID=A0A4Q1KAM1_9FLAO|nr:DUF6146 family protein [Flavobacterium stagni]RXR22637.1 hypothetical protein EQG61_08635 [Flavobacterium stagni]
MKKCVLAGILIIAIWACASPARTASQDRHEVAQKEDTIRIANDSLEYEVIIIEPGFNSWVNGTARGRGYYSEQFLENRNRIWVQEWNRRVLQPQQYNPNLYELQINYDPHIHYGYEVNYLIYNYFIYFQMHYKQKLGTFDVRP